MSTPDLSSGNWRKSTYSDSEGDNCIEVARVSTAVAVRDSTDPEGPRLAFGRAAFGALADDIRAGRYDR